jgi:hypothetical protein
MLIDRRSFMQGAALFAAGSLLPLSSDSESCASSHQGTASTESVVTGTAPSLAFRVNGWDSLGESSGDEIFISVSHVWRTAWR